jgi:hypothetical protein
MASLLRFLSGSFIPYNIPVYPGALRVAENPPQRPFPVPGKPRQKNM